MEVRYSLSAVRDSSICFRLRVITSWRSVLVDRTKDKGIVGDIVERRTDENRWKEEAGAISVA